MLSFALLRFQSLFQMQIRPQIRTWSTSVLPNEIKLSVFSSRFLLSHQNVLSDQLFLLIKVVLRALIKQKKPAARS